MEDERAKAKRLKLQAVCRRISGEIVASLPRSMQKRVGFTLFLYDLSDASGDLAYVSNGNRADVRQMLHEFLRKTGD